MGILTGQLFLKASSYRLVIFKNSAPDLSIAYTVPCDHSLFAAIAVDVITETCYNP
jgi:hypothetical protein